MISRHKYLMALDTIRQYNAQLREAEIIATNSDTQKTTQTVTLDDTWYSIEIEEVPTRSLTKGHFYELVPILLTERQEEDFISHETNRVFEVHKQRVAEMMRYVNIHIK